MPGSLKRSTLRQYARAFDARVFVEAGTYLGETIATLRKDFERLFSIELDQTLHRDAVARFARCKNIRILQGDSGLVLSTLLPELRGQRVLFWLDGHFSGEQTTGSGRPAPILAEIDTILGAGLEMPVILIDDARCFKGDGEYPTLEGLRRHVVAQRPGLTFTEHDDIIRIHPEQANDPRYH